MIIESLVNTLNNAPTMITWHYTDNQLVRGKNPKRPLSASQPSRLAVQQVR